MKKTAIVGVVLVVAAAGLIAYSYRTKPTPSQPAVVTPPPVATEPVPSATKPTTTTGLHAGLTYTKAINQYANRIQFVGCSGRIGTSGSSTLSIKKGTKFMLDNRDPKAHTITWGTQSYRLVAYDFAIVSATKTGTFNVTCDGGGSATLKVGA